MLPAEGGSVPIPIRARRRRRAGRRATAALVALATACVPSPPAVRRPSPDAAALERAVLGTLDPSADPCADFYQYACGGWLAAVPPPADRPQVMRSFSSIDARNRMLLVRVLERETDTPGHRQASAFFDSCMDVAGVEATGLHPLAPWLAEIDAAQDLPAVFAAAASLRRAAASPLVTLAIERDPLDPGRHVLLVAPGGLGLPDPRLYLDEERGLASEYRAHVARMLELSGVRAPRARQQARGILELETALARAALGPGEAARDGTAREAVVRGRAALAALDPGLPWDAYFAALGAPQLDALEVASPAFVRAVGPALREAGPETLRAYLRWQLLHALARRLPRAWDEQDFAFESTLTGAVAMPPRPERCAEATLAALPDETSRAYVAAAFAGESRALASAMVDGIAAAFLASLPSVGWMDDDTRAAAAAKARAVVPQVGHPEPWPPGAGFAVQPHRYLENTLAAASARLDRELAAAGAPVDPAAWPVAPIAMRGFYDPRANQIVLPAGLLQPPLFDVALPAAMRWGAAGAMIGHEWTHGFDAQGQLFDAAGRLAPWWSEATAAAFSDASQCLVDRYASFDVAPGLHVDGKLTFAENAADLGGVALAHRAWRAEAGDRAGARSPIAGLSEEQLFFVAYAQTWCARAQPAYDAAMARSDARARPRFRVDGPLPELPAFREAFSCPPAPVCRIW
jgi:endothelin-converting enzyme/putative endopeptidase